MSTNKAKKSPMQVTVRGVELGVWSLPKSTGATLPLIQKTPAEVASTILSSAGEISERAKKITVDREPLSAAVSPDVLNESID